MATCKSLIEYLYISHIYISTLLPQCFAPLFKSAAYSTHTTSLPRTPFMMIHGPQPEFSTLVQWRARGPHTPESPGGTPSSQTTPYPKWVSGARLHLTTYCIPPQCAKPAAVAILCSCFDDKAILNRSANTWRPTRFKWRPPSLIANKLLIDRPFIDPYMWIQEVKVGIKPQCFSLAKHHKQRLKGR